MGIKMEKWKKRSVDLLTSLAFGSKGSPSVVPYYPQKTEISSEEEKYFKRTTPEKHGISSKRVYNMLCELESEKRSNVHTLFVIKDGEVIVECAREGYGINTWHLSHSMSKSITGIAVGFLFDDGLLNLSSKVASLFPEVKYKDKRFADITVNMLLSMTSGVSFNEAGAVTETDWTAAFFGSSLKFNPGTKFNYNSMNSYILARIVEKLSGMRFIDYVDKRLFSPLHITNYFWEIGPEGVEKGGWGLYMSPESWAKVGLMMLSGGMFEGNRILSSPWVKLSTSLHAESPMSTGDFNYGYQLWVGRQTKEVLFNGMLGQNVWICPDNNIVAVIFSGNNELFQDSPTVDIIRRHLGCKLNDVTEREDVKILSEKESTFFDSRRWVMPLEKKRGLLRLLGLRSKTPFDERFTPLLGRYAFGMNNAGVLPLFISAMQNNLDHEIEEIAFVRASDDLYIKIKERGVEYSFLCGFYGYAENILDIRGERYVVKIMASAHLGPDNEGEYRIECLLPEMPNSRYLRITKVDEGALRFSFSEMPNNKILDNLIERAVEENAALGFMIDLFEKRFGDRVIEKKLEKTFAPSLIGANVDYEGYEMIVAGENSRAAYESFGVKLLRSIVDKFFKEVKPEDNKGGVTAEEPLVSEAERAVPKK